MFLDECFSDKFKRLSSGGGCHTLEINDDKRIHHYALGTFECESMGQKQKCKAQLDLIWSVFKSTHLDVFGRVLISSIYQRMA